MRTTTFCGGVVVPFDHKWFAPLIVFAAAAIPFASAVMVQRLVLRRRSRCRESWRLVSEELERRHGLVADLITAARRLVDAATLERIAYLNQEARRPERSVSKEVSRESTLSVEVRALLVRIERLPEAKSDAHLHALLAAMDSNDQRIQGACRYYNALVKDHNERLETFPSNFVASLLGVPDEPYLTMSPLFDRHAVGAS